MTKGQATALANFVKARAADPGNPRGASDRALIAVADWVKAEGTKDADWAFVESLFGGGDDWDWTDVSDLFDDPEKAATAISTSIHAGIALAYSAHPEFDQNWVDMLPAKVRTAAR